MKNMTLALAAKACGGRLCGVYDENTELGRAVIDSRAVEPGDLFVAYKGEKVDGHDFIASAFDRGAACCLAQRVPLGETRPILLVEDVQRALERIAAAYRDILTLPLVGITGSVGKTSAKEMIASVLEQRLSVLKTDKNLNNQIGVPMTISRIEPEHEAAVVEMGIDILADEADWKARLRTIVDIYIQKADMLIDRQMSDAFDTVWEELLQDSRFVQEMRVSSLDQDFNLNLLGRRIKEKWDVELYATYSSTEMGATFSECRYGCGGHVHPELIIVEIIGEDDRPVPDGQVGEIVVTTLGVEGMPLLRFRTGDICKKVTEQCRCGRWSYRLTPLVGRKNNMIKFKGTTLYPPMIIDVLDNCRDIAGYQVVLGLNDLGSDDVKVRIGVADPDPDRDARLVADLKNTFRAKIRVAPGIEVCRADVLARDIYRESSRKPLKVIDLRPKN